jgi:(p)ppGpp synthase/HD superfamily hydrolase
MMILSKRFLDAVEYAFYLHAGHMRKGTKTPYFSHLMGVASLVMEHGGTEDEAIAALLHDAVEDQGGQDTLDAIRALFGTKVGAIVKGCSDSFTTPKPPWKERRVKYIKHLRNTKNASIRLVSAADKLHNARAILVDYRQHKEKLWKRFNEGKDGQLWYYGKLAKVFKAKGPSALAVELDAVVSEIKNLVASVPKGS